MADGAELGLDVRDEFLDQRVAERAVIGRVHVVGVAVGAGAVQLQQDQARGVVGQPGLAEFGCLRHLAEDACVAAVQASDADAERIAPRRLARVVAGQDDPRAKEDGRP